MTMLTILISSLLPNIQNSSLCSSSKMSLTKIIAILVLFVTQNLAQSNDRGHISIVISQTGLEFAKDYLINDVVSTILPLHLPDIEKKVKIPLIGKVRMGLSKIQLFAVNILSSSIGTGQDGIFLNVLGATADLNMDWVYAYKASFFQISDHGNASVKVEGIDLKINVKLVDDNGSLKIASRGSKCTVKSIDIHINGGASWLYQGLVDAFEKKIISAVENTVSDKILEKLNKFDSKLHSLPKERKIDDYVAMNLTFTDNPILDDSSVEVDINGLFMPHGDVIEVPGYQSSSLFRGVKRMVTISIHEEVFNSGTFVYFNEKRMNVDIETKDGSILNTSDWKFILPALYKQYPDLKLILRISVTSPPAVTITENGINGTIRLDISINVEDSGAVLPVASISSVLKVAASAKIVENNLAGTLKLIGFNATMKWSKIGDLQANYIQDTTSTILETLFLPYVNKRIKRGFPLPFPHGFKIKNTELVFVENCIMVGTDIASYIK